MPSVLSSVAILLVGLKEELGYIAILFVMILLFYFLKVAFGYVGIFFAIFGFVLVRTKQTGKVELQGKRGDTQFKTSIRGPLAIFLIVGGFAVAITDSWRNGPSAYAEAATEARRRITVVTKTALET